MRVAEGLTVVGDPVVYACRMSAAPGGKTYLNQRAYEQISQQFGACCFFSETQIELKYEGSTTCYEVRRNANQHVLVSPVWVDRLAIHSQVDN